MSAATLEQPTAVESLPPLENADRLPRVVFERRYAAMPGVKKAELFLREGDYRRLSPADGIFRSEVFPGLWLDAEALLDGRMERVAAVQRDGLASAEHRAFADRLRAGRGEQED